MTEVGFRPDFSRRTRDARALRAHVTSLVDEFEKNKARIASLELRQEKLQAEMAEFNGILFEAENANVRAVGDPITPGVDIAAELAVVVAPAARPDLFRAADAGAERFGTFTLPELGAYVGVKPAALRSWVRERLAGDYLSENGKFKSQVMYEWVAEDLPASQTREALARDWIATFPTPFSPWDFAKATGYVGEDVDKALGVFARRGMIREVGVEGLELYEYVPPDSAGRAAEIDGERPREAPIAEDAPRRGAPVDGTGKKMVISHPEMRSLVARIEAGGGKVRHAANGHLEVTFNGNRCLISSTPSSSRSVLNDRVRVRRLGLNV